MKFYLIFLLIGVAFAIKCAQDSHCGAPDIAAKCVDGKCEFTQLHPVNRTRRSVRNSGKLRLHSLKK
uniref:Uncharacterized protein n=1 Tax=Caenorhabditis tropicalis TaxID=1561998 RepID=A0A1I7TNQ9_9PELO